MSGQSRPKTTKRDVEREAGFTLVELLVVLAIIGLIAALAAPRVLRYLGTARVDTTKVQLQNISSALELYYLDSGQYPSQELGLVALASAPNDGSVWNGPYLKGETALKDSWGNAFVYERDGDGSGVSVKSLGRDGKPEGSELDADIAIKVQ